MIRTLWNGVPVMAVAVVVTRLWSLVVIQEHRDLTEDCAIKQQIPRELENNQRPLFMQDTSYLEGCLNSMLL